VKELLKKLPLNAIMLGIILIAACLLRMIPALTCQAVPDYSDMALYNETALSEGIPSFPPPGYPLFLRAIYMVFGALNYRAVFIVQALLSTVTVFLIYLATKRIFDTKAGLFAAGLAAVYPNFVAYNMTTMTESLSVFIVALLLLLITSSLGENRKSILAGLVVFLGYLVKPAFLFFVPGMLIGARKRLPLLASLVITFGSFMIYGFMTDTGEGRGPVMLYKAYNRVAASKTHIRMEETELGGSEEISGRDYLDETYEFVLSNKWMTFDIIFGKVTVLISRGYDQFVLKDIVGRDRWLRIPLMTYGYLAIFIPGIIGLLRKSTRKSRIVALMIFSFITFHILITIFKIRYRLPIEPLLIVFAGVTLASIRIYRPGYRLDPGELLGRLRSVSASFIGSIRNTARSIVKSAAAEFRPDWDLLSVILLVTIALRIYFPMAIEISHLDQEASHLNDLAVSGGIGTSEAPLYPLFLRMVYAIFGESNYKAVFLIQGLLSSAAVIMIYVITSRLWTRRAGILAAALAAIYPRFLTCAVSISPISTGIFIVVLLLLLLSKDLQQRSRTIFAGILVGSATFLHPLLIFLVPGTLAVLKKNRTAFLITLIVLLTPLAIRNSAVDGKIVPVYSPSAYAIDLRKFENPEKEDPRISEGLSADDAFKGSRDIRKFKVPPKVPPIIRKSKVPSLPRLLDGLYSNMSIILGRDWRDNYESGKDPQLRNSNYVNSYSYIIIIVFGIAGLFKYGKKRHLRVTLPVLCYLAFLVMFTMLHNKHYMRYPWEPILIIYIGILMSRQKQPDSSPA